MRSDRTIATLRVCLNDGLDGGPAVCGVGTAEGTCRAECCFAGGGPKSEVGHARKPADVKPAQVASLFITLEVTVLQFAARDRHVILVE
jgi:hypothetical protein